KSLIFIHKFVSRHSDSKYGYLSFIILDSERNDECIDFTMLCVFFFLCLCTRERVEIMLEFQTLGVVSDSLSNLVGALGRSFFEFPNSFQKPREKPKKITEKREFLRKTSLRPKRIFLYGCNSKNSHCKYMKFSPNLNFQKCLTFFEIKNTTLIAIEKTRSIIKEKILSTSYKPQILENFTIPHNSNIDKNSSLKHKPPFSLTTGNYILGWQKIISVQNQCGLKAHIGLLLFSSSACLLNTIDIHIACSTCTVTSFMKYAPIISVDVHKSASLSREIR
ncbi:Uncharacterized protein FWK35_00026439, partial [Aphis craccivora]